MNYLLNFIFLVLALSLFNGCATIQPPQLPVDASDLRFKNCTGPTVNNLREGKWLCKNNKGITTFEGVFAAGRKHGLVRLWREDGSLDTESHWENGNLEGLLTDYFPNGRKYLEATYRQQTPDGVMTEWFENGNKKSELNYLKGTLNGWVREWNENGELKSEEFYQNGQLLTPDSK